MPQRVAYVLLVQSPTGWRTTVAEIPRALACGALVGVPATASLAEATESFEFKLRESWGVTEPVVWQPLRPDWWAAELVTGSLRDAGELDD